MQDEDLYIPIETGFVENLWIPDMYLWYLSELEVIKFLIPFSGKWILRLTQEFWISLGSFSLVYKLLINSSGICYFD